MLWLIAKIRELRTKMFYDIDTRSEQPPNVLNLLEDIVASLDEEGGNDAVETSGLKNIEKQKL